MVGQRCPSGDISSGLGPLYCYDQRSGLCYWSEWVEARGAATHSAKHRTASYTRVIQPQVGTLVSQQGNRAPPLPPHLPPLKDLCKHQRKA